MNSIYNYYRTILFSITMSFCLNCTKNCADNYVSCITCNNRLHYVCFHDAKLLNLNFSKYLIEMFNSPYFNFTCKPCTTSPNQNKVIDKCIDMIQSNAKLIQSLKTDITSLSSVKSYAEALNSKDLAKSITKQMAIFDRSNKTCVIFGLLEESTDNLLNDLGLNESANLSKINSDNLSIHKLSISNSIHTVKSLMKNFSNVVDKYKKYPNVFIRPDQSFEDRLTRIILIAGAKTIPGNIKCVFNNRILEYELRSFTINNDKTTINWDCEVKYSEAEFSKWKNSFTSSNNN